MKPIVVISGTNRAESRSLQLARHVEEIYGGLGAATQLLDLAQLPGDIFHPGIYGEKPASFQPWADAITGSAGLALIVPEYNGSFPGILKYFIDLLPFPESFEGRPVSFIGLASGGWGALRAVEHLQGVFGYRNAHIFPKRVFLPQVGANFQQDGSLAPDLEKRLHQQAESFLHYVQRFSE
jgi:chromate reductase